MVWVENNRISWAQMKYGDRVHSETAYVIKNQSLSLLSRRACSFLGLVTCNVGETTEIKFRQFPGLFTGLGLLRNYTYKITLKQGSYLPACIHQGRSHCC